MSESGVKNYSPDKILCLFGGVPIKGFGEDTMISVNPLADLSTVKVGADGEVSRSRGTNKCCEVELTLMQTSASNDVLTGYVELDEVTGSLTLPFMMQDLLGRTMFMVSQAWVSKRPAIVMGREAGDRVWTLTTGRPSIWINGGNF